MWGTPRRLFLTLCRPGHVRENLAKRSGECLRCGACCRLVVKCRFLKYDNGVPSCRLYSWFRFPNCTKFPMNRQDIADRDIISPNKPCGYSLSESKKGRG